MLDATTGSELDLTHYCTAVGNAGETAHKNTHDRGGKVSWWSEEGTQSTNHSVPTLQGSPNTLTKPVIELCTVPSLSALRFLVSNAVGRIIKER